MRQKSSQNTSIDRSQFTPTCVDQSGFRGSYHAQLEPIRKQQRLLGGVTKVGFGHSVGGGEPGFQHALVHLLGFWFCRKHFTGYNPLQIKTGLSVPTPTLTQGSNFSRTCCTQLNFLFYRLHIVQ